MASARRCGVAGAALVAVLAHAAAAQAQGATGAIAGTIVDTSGAPLAGATVDVLNTETRAVRETVTNGSGVFAVPELPPGPYEVSAALQGFATRRQSNVAVHAGTTAALRLELRVAPHPETITDAGTPPYVDRTEPRVVEVVEAEAVASLPVRRRDARALGLLAPGVARDVRGGGLSAAGLPPRATRSLVDGIDLPGLPLGVEAVREIVVTSGAAPAEYGHAGGATLQAVTQSGTNRLRGSAYEFFGDESLNANTARNERLGRPEPEYGYNQFGGSIGGPALEDEHFFFAAYDGVRTTGPADANALFVRTDHLPGDALRPSFRYLRHGLGGASSHAFAGTVAGSIGVSLFNEARFSTLDRDGVADTLTWVTGAHVVKSGVDVVLDDDRYSLFVQDDWHAGPAFTLNAGVRYDRETFGSAGGPDAATSTLGPRLGAALAPAGRRYVVRGSYGLFPGGAPDARVHRLNAGIEWEWMPHTSLAADYLFADGSDLRPGGFEPVFLTDARYNGLSVEMSRRFAQNHSYRVAYSVGRVEELVPGPVPEVRHRFTGSVVYATDAFADRFDGIAQALLEAWTLSAIYDAQTAAPSWISLDARAARHVNIGGRARLTILWEAFNLLNRANPTIALTPLLLDRMDPRMMQIAARVSF